MCVSYNAKRLSWTDAPTRAIIRSLPAFSSGPKYLRSVLRSQPISSTELLFAIRTSTVCRMFSVGTKVGRPP